MKYSRSENFRIGFSLMEVMFAVVILAMGLVFVATQFPVAISQVRDVVDETNKIIDAHNAQVMLELQLSQFRLLPGYDQKQTLDRRASSYNLAKPYPENDIMTMHVLAKPNILFNPASSLSDPITGKDWPILVLDDPENYADYIINIVSKEPLWPFWSQHTTVPTPYDGYFEHYSNAFIGDIGHIMSPPVDESDPKVVEILKTVNYDPTIMDDRVQYLHPAIFEVSLERNYTWAAMYHQGSNEYYIFTLRNPKKAVRYAAQLLPNYNPPYYLMDQSDWGAPYANMAAELITPTPAIASLDRLFPVPWLVCLGPDSQRLNVTGWSDDFVISEKVADILRTGSIIVDADPADPDYADLTTTPPSDPQTTGWSGLIYEVADVYLDDANPPQYHLKLRTPLEDDLHYFWVFPPPIKRAGNDYEFEDTQPVVEVTKKLINY